MEGAQPRFQSWGSNFLVWGITALLQKKLERYTQFGAVCYSHQTPTKKLLKKLGVVRPIFIAGVPDSPTPIGCAHALWLGRSGFLLTMRHRLN